MLTFGLKKKKLNSGTWCHNNRPAHLRFPFKGDEGALQCPSPLLGQCIGQTLHSPPFLGVSGGRPPLPPPMLTPRLTFLRCGCMATLGWSPRITEWNRGKSSTRKLVCSWAPVMITGALEFVHMYVGRHMSYIFYTEILFQYLKCLKKMILKEYIFICLSASWESVCWKRERSERHISTVLKQSVECWRACVKMWNVEETCSLHPTCPLLFAKVVFQSFIRSTETPEWYDLLTLSQCQKNGNYALMYFNLACENSLVPCSCAI